MKTIIMAGGKGTRISTMFPDIPKPLIPIQGIPVLEREICMLHDQGYKDIIITISHLGFLIQNYFGDGSKWDVCIQYYNEITPLGNAGALFKLRNEIGNDDFLLLNADALFDVDFNRMAEYHKSRNALVTLFTHPNSHPYDSGLVITDDKGCVIQWLAKEEKRPEFYKNRVNAGLHIINPAILDINWSRLSKAGEKNADGNIKKVDLDRHILKPLAGSGCMYCYDSPEYVKDMGTPERYNEVQEDYKKGIVKSKNLKNKQKAIFLDRDGTINKYVGFLTNESQFELKENVAKAIKKINESGFLAIVCTNQPVIARGEVTFSQLEGIHNKMETLLGFEGAYLDAVYYCPHHPHKGYKGEVPELKIECGCRKPEPGMLLRAAIQFNIDLSRSWIAGDGENDIKAGKKAGCKTVLIDTENKPDSFGADIVSKSLYEAVNIILEE